ncbi:hypothetical protein AB1Y20_005982 [Prymnesium parvum]|uniref:Monocarboxylate transporter n=1 Tax=Prymnesium parvum TaxID=97485 RepID=A0AB34J2M1_PRYPA
MLSRRAHCCSSSFASRLAHCRRPPPTLPPPPARSVPAPHRLLSGSPPPPAPWFSDERIRVSGSFNRWLQLIPACVAGVGIGTYASVPAVLGPFVCRAQGVVAQAPADFAISDLLPVATMMPLIAGVCAAALASQSERFGHRRLALVCSVVYPLGVYGLSAAAVSAHSLPAFAMSYAVLGGFGFYCGYPQLPPFLSSTWFPDRRGLVMSLYMASFGSGMLFAVPVLQRLLGYFRAAPIRLGGFDEVATHFNEAGQRLALVDGVEREVITATARDLVESGFGSTLSEGVFLLGTGSNGACEAMAAMGCGVFVLMQLAAWGYRLPATKVYQLPRAAKDDAGRAAPPQEGAPAPDVPLQLAMYTPNFYLLFAGSVGVCLTGLPFIQLGKFMVNDIFGGALGPSAAPVAAAFPSIVAAANMGGRMLWGPISDKIGCAATTVIFGASVPALLLGPYATGVVASDSALALQLFQTSALCSIGIFAGMPVVLAPAAAEIFGSRYSGEIYRRLWLTVPLANFVGTTIMSRARDGAYSRYCEQLAANVDDDAFFSAFGAAKSDITSLISHKTVTLPLLMKISPEGTVDPSPFLYNDVFYGIAGCSALALVCNIAAFKIPIRRQ